MPADLFGVLAEVGLQVAGPQVRPARPVRWTALDRQGRRWAVATASAHHAPEARRWARTVASIDHGSLGTASAVLDLPDGGVAVLVAAEPGVDLALLLDTREPLDDAEAVTVLGAVADALAALHAAGLARGGLNAADVILTEHGPVLDPGDPGAPGTGSTGPVQDVEALAALGRQICRDAEGSAVVEACAAHASRDAAHLADRIREAAPASAVRMPDPEVLARRTLRRIAGHDSCPRQGRTESRNSRAERRPHRTHRAGGVRRLNYGRFGGLFVAGALAVTLVGFRAGDGWSATSAPRPERAGPARFETVRAELAEQAAVRLSTARIEAMAAGSTERLAALTEPGSAAAVADADLRFEPVEVVDVAVTASAVTGDWTGDCPVKQVCVSVRHEVTFAGGATDSGQAIVALRPGSWLVVEVLESAQS